MAATTQQHREPDRLKKPKKPRERTAIRIPAGVLDETEVSKKSNLYKLSRVLLTQFHEFKFKSGKKLSQLHTRFSVDYFDIETTVMVRPAGQEAELKFHFTQRALPLKQYSVFLQQTENGYDVNIDLINIKIDFLHPPAAKFEPQEIGQSVVEITKGINEILRDNTERRINLSFEGSLFLDQMMKFKEGIYLRRIFELIGLMSMVNEPRRTKLPEDSIITLGRDDRAKLTFNFPERTVSAQTVSIQFIPRKNKS